jgi:D-alanyl-D-alanine carboxypeptidase
MMSRSMNYPALILAAILLLPAASPSPAPSINPQMLARARAIFLGMQSGQLDRTQLAPSALAQLTPALVQRAADRLQKMGTVTGFTFVASRSLMTTQGTGYEFRAFFSRAQPRNFYVAIDPQGKILGLLFWPYQAQAHLTQAQLLAALRGKMQRDAAAGTFSGAVVLAKGGSPIFAQAYGLADRGRLIPNTFETRFRIGSMNKMFTAVAVLQLVQDGKMSLDDPIGKFIPNYPNSEVATKVTVEELLTHTGGTGDIFGAEFDAHRLQLRTLDDYVKLYGTRGPAFTPGSRFDYSNYGFILLGVAIEHASGQSYYDYVRTHVYQPAGMTSTGSEPEDVPVRNRAVGYTVDKGKITANTSTLPFRGTSAGGGYSTVGDLLRFANALQSHLLLNPTYTVMLTTGKVRESSFPDEDDKYAYGFDDQTQNDIRCFGHNGGAPGMSGSLEICPGPGYTVVALANIDPPAADDVTDFVIDNMPL